MSVEQNIVNQVADFLTDDPRIFNEGPPPPPPKKKQHSLPKPIYPGSAEDKKRKARQAADDKQREAERHSQNRSPFGDSFAAEISKLIQD